MTPCREFADTCPWRRIIHDCVMGTAYALRRVYRPALNFKMIGALQEPLAAIVAAV